MVLLCKHRALYVKACIIANGVTDSQGDTLQAEDIKKIFTSFNNSDNFEIYHNEIPIENVSLLENYIATADESIGTSNVPAGSWLAVIRVDNPDIQERLLNGEFKGVSLNNKIAVECKGSLTGAVRYQDVADAECVIPVYISFVEAGANGYGLHVMDYDAYIHKSKTVTTKIKSGDKIMDFKEFIDGLKSLIQKAEEDTPKESAKTDGEGEDQPKEEEEEAVEVKKEEKPKEEEEVVKKATTNEDEDEEKKPAIEKEAEPTTEPSAKEDKADEITKLEERISKLEKIIEELTKEEEDTKEDEKEVKEETDTPKITKSKNVILENQSNTVNTNYYEMTGRDPITGVKIRNQSKIM